ncbi:hypothetical protein DFH11DRAFT_1583818 [Phellopilus nigrolimitatus]|nr:hypothetical protein DFH11DRAFT_1583818 [Phellopilus nigrolimitatus]
MPGIASRRLEPRVCLAMIDADVAAADTKANSESVHHEVVAGSSRGETQKKRRKTYRYRGHRAASFTAEDIDELIELRARLRTFDGAYSRTALGNLGYALMVLKLFDRRFYHIGLLYTIFAALLFILSFLRTRHSQHDFADCYRANGAHGYSEVIKTVGQTDKRIYGRPFVTAGWIVLGVTLVVAAVEIGLLVLVLKLCG